MEKRMIGFEVKDNRAYVAGTCEKAYLEMNLRTDRNLELMQKIQLKAIFRN